MKPLNKTQKVDPVERQARERATQQAFSPMDLPDAFSVPDADSVAYEDMHPVLQAFIDEHETVVDELDAFEQTLRHIQEHGVGADTRHALAHFFRFFDEHVVPHRAREERAFFAELRERLLASGAHSQSASPTTSVDVLEADHARLLQMAAVTFNLFGLSARLPDADSRAVTFDAAMEQGKALVERLRLHVYREDHVVFPLVQKHFSTDELDAMDLTPAS